MQILFKKIKRRIQKGSSSNFPKIQQFSTDVDALFKNDDGNYCGCLTITSNL